ncbi:MAG: transglycosylase domain-containing protein [Balneolaceae bacterium]|nr:transglycosylase domain-containing protein [Balneolaceae bacterium]
MSNRPPGSDDDMDRYFNDPEYRRRKSEERRRESDGPSAGGSGNGFFINFFSTRRARYIAGAAAVFVLLTAAFVGYLFTGLPSIEQLENPETAVASTVLSRDGAILDKYYTQNRTHVPMEEISPHVVDALIATEDHRFYNHWGIDMVRTLAIPWHLLNGRVQGGSTLTQQLARNLYPEIRGITVLRKLREMITAIDIEQNYTKREIIELYLNTVEFPNSAFGIEMAAQTHYGKPAKDLTISEAATLVGSLQAIYANNPRVNPDNARSRRNTVLNQMEKRGFLEPEVNENLKEQPIVLNYQPPSRSGRETRYFGQYVRQQIEPWAKANGYDLDTDGLTIHTTIDSRLQRHAEEALITKLDTFQVEFQQEWTTPGSDKYMNEYWSRFSTYLREYIRETDRYKNAFSKLNTDQESVVFEQLMADSAFVDSVKRAHTRLEAGFVAIDPSNGNIMAWVGGSDYGNVQFDHVYQSRRQTGSTFKPFVYTVAIDNGYRPYHRFSKYPTKFYDRQGNAWTPTDPTVPEGPEQVPLAQALGRSLNNVTVRLLPELAGASGTSQLEDLYPAARKIKQMASNMGIDMSQAPTVPSLALGTANVSLLELVSAYTTFANEGVHIEPIAITRIEDKEGNIIREYHPEMTREVISAETAYMMTDMLRGVVRGGEDWYGTGVRLQNSYGVRQDVAGKTGTTQNSADNWFVAMMPHLVMGAWVGGEDRRIRFPQDTWYGQGARTALPIVGSFINRATSDPEAPWSYDSFQPPAGYVPPTPPDSAEQQTVGEGRIDW